MWKCFFYLLVGAIVAAALHWLLGVQIGFSALIAFLAWPIVGTIITADDDLPGGFGNPSGKAIPPWRTASYWGQLFGGCALVCIAFLAQLGFSGPWALYFIPAAILSAFACGALLLRARKPARQHAG